MTIGAPGTGVFLTHRFRSSAAPSPLIPTRAHLIFDVMLLAGAVAIVVKVVGIIYGG